MQTLVVALLVLGCFVYALWTLAPKGPRRRLANALLTWPLPDWLRKPVLAAARLQGSCGCDGCDKPALAKATPATKPVIFVRKR